MSEHLVVQNNAFAQWTLYTPFGVPWFLCFVDSFDLSNLSRFSRNRNFFLLGFMILLIFHDLTHRSERGPIVQSSFLIFRLSHERI